MSLADASRTGVRPGDDEEQLVEIAARLRISTTRLARLLRRESASGFTPSRHSILASLKRLGPITLGELAEQEGIAPPSITRAVAKLESVGLLERLPDPADRRVVRVALTREGASVLRQAQQRKTTWLRQRIATLTHEERQRLQASLDVLELLVGQDPE